MSTAMRAKFYITSVEKFSETSEKVNFSAVAAKAYGPDGVDEDNTYAKYSPSASCSIHIVNPALTGKFAPGDKFYVDFTPVPKEAA